MQRPPSDSEESNFGRNRDIPNGSLEAALQTDRKPELYLERPPSLEAMPREELQDMVPEFMHRDFYRSREGHPIAFPSQERPLPLPPEPSPKARRLSKRTPRFVSGRRPVPYETPQTEPALDEGFFDPYQESDEFEGLDLKETISVGLPPLPQEPEIEPEIEPQEPQQRPHRPSSSQAIQERGVLAPLRSVRSGAEPPESSTPARSSAPSRAPASPAALEPQPLRQAPGESQQPAGERSGSRPSWAAPLLVALLVLTAVFVWREQERQEVVAASTVSVPLAVPQASSLEPAGEGSLLDLEDTSGLTPEEKTAADRPSDQKGEGRDLTDDGQAEDPDQAAAEALAAGAPQGPTVGQGRAPGDDRASAGSGSGSGSGNGSASPDPADLFPETAAAAPSAPRDTAAAPPPARAQDRERRLQSSSSLFPGDDGASAGGSSAGADAAGLFPQVPEAASVAPQPAAAPAQESRGAELFPGTRDVSPAAPPQAAVEAPDARPAPAVPAEPKVESPQPVEAILPPPSLPGQRPAPPARPPATDASKYHISEPSF